VSDWAIRVEGIGKRYRIGAAGRRPQTLREALANLLAAPFRRLRQLGPLRGTEAAGQLFWALQDISFELKPGEVLGLVGRNGAGKSTLLKILSRITTPTTGYADVFGRVGSLLEVGTGFHPELTGRDNVYLNGAVLGMSRDYIDTRFDEIVEFAGVGRLLDTPVKHYSSGMSLRLAFAVAAHLEAEILIVDEVLAVGDAEFQKRCLGKMSSVAGEGRTILFVSHNLNAIQRMCPRSILLEGGRIVADGPTREVLARYLRPLSPDIAPGRWIDLTGAERTGSQEAYFAALRYYGEDVGGGNASPDGALELQMVVHANARLAVGSLAVGFYDDHGTKLVNADTTAIGATTHLAEGRTTVGLRIRALHLTPGVYRVALSMYDPLAGRLLDQIDAALMLEVVDLQGQALGRRSDGVATCDFEVFTPGESPPPNGTGVLGMP
jgi:homopolymeric O-antigen transport system ATP-binding protein